MTYIDKNEEILIDRMMKDKDIGTALRFQRGSRTFIIDIRQIFCYGEVDFNDEENLDYIDNFKFLNHLEGRGVGIYSNYDYNTHTCSSPKKSAQWTETWSCSELARYAHGCLGKPKRIVLFNQEVKK